MKKIRKSSLAIAGIYFLFLEAIGIYLNPYISDAYRLAHADVLEAIFRIIRFDGKDMAFIWIFLAVILLGKDPLIGARLSFMLNLIFLAGLVLIYLLYPVAVDLIHLPISSIEFSSWKPSS